MSNRYSKSSILFFDKLLEKLSEYNLKYTYYYKDDELYENIQNTGYYIDLTILIEDKKFAIEYQSDIVREDKKASYFWERTKINIKIYHLFIYWIRSYTSTGTRC